MNNIKQSLEANKAEILASLPKEFHQDFEKELANATPAPAPLTGEAQIEAIKAELVANPEVNEKEAAPELTNIKASEPLTPPTSAELEKEQAELLTEAKAMGAYTPEN